MRMMYRRFPLAAGGYTIADFQHTVEECAGQSMEDFFSLYVRGTAPLPWETTLLAAGIEIKPKETPMKPSLGFTTQAAGDRPKIARVLTGSPAEDVGLQAGDEIVALDSIRVRQTDIDDRLALLKDGTNVRVTYFRNDLLREATVTARYFGPPQYRAQLVPATTPLQKSILDSWLKTPPDVRAAQK